MEYPADTEAVSITELLPFPPWNEFPRIDYGGDGEHCLIVCGYLQGDAVLFDPVLRALPSMFVVRPPAGPAAAWVSASVEYTLMASERNNPTARRNQALPELLFAEVLRIYLESGDAELTGLLAALRDPVVGHTLTLLHADPRCDWSVGELASEVAVSKTVLVDRFGQLLGRPPIKYLTDWRLSLASGLLRTTHLSVGEIGARVGYNSEESFESRDSSASWAKRPRTGAPTRQSRRRCSRRRSRAIRPQHARRRSAGRPSRARGVVASSGEVSISPSACAAQRSTMSAKPVRKRPTSTIPREPAPGKRAAVFQVARERSRCSPRRGARAEARTRGDVARARRSSTTGRRRRASPAPRTLDRRACARLLRPARASARRPLAVIE